MKKIFISTILSCYILGVAAQTDSLSLLNEVRTKLKNGVSVSTILTDSKYLIIHPATEFRKLIEASCSQGIVKITTANEPGRKIRVLGTVKNADGQSVAGALVYLYQTDSKGWYAADAPHVLQFEGDVRHARLFGYIKTDSSGMFELHTVKPSGYPRSDLPAHIHVHITATGYRSYVTEFLFDDDERLVGAIRKQSEQNQFLISKPEKTKAPFDQQFSYRMILLK
jgi:protocatechuate 3,4-dioxygenase beta subunit